MPVFGAGISRPLGLPDWKMLIDRLSDHSEVTGRQLGIEKSSHTSRTQMLYQHFRRRFFASRTPPVLLRDVTVADERMAQARWIEIVQQCLYDAAKPATDHPYLKAFLPIVRQAPLTVNYNFDDTIQELLDLEPSRGAGGIYETVWDSTVQFRNTSAVIYHPNGFLPRKLQRGPSDAIVFAEDSFADQLIDAQRGHYSTLLSHMFRFTSLLMGLSLDDATLKHLLRQSLHANPGHVHYYVAFVADDDKSHADRRTATLDSNFETYNLLTLYLKGSEFESLAKLLTLEDTDFARIVDDADLPKAYTFYLSGAVGVGKTSSLARFKSLNTFDEWIDPKPPLLHQAAKDLSDIEREEVDTWVDRQFRQKNLLVKRCEGTINVIDRSPIDPLAFAKPGVTSERVTSLRKTFRGTHGSGIDVAEGVVVFMTGTAEVLQTRVQQRHKGGTVSYVAGLQERFKAMWRIPPTGVHHLNTVDLPLAEVARRIARIIHFEEYQPVNISELLSSDLASKIDAVPT